MISTKVEGITLDAARSLCDDIKAENPLSVTVIAIVNEGKANFVCACGKEAVAKGMNAGKIVKELAVICGGGGGGRPDSATAGIKDISNYEKAYAHLPNIITRDVK